MNPKVPPSVSVVIPTKDRLDCLGRCLASISRQTTSPFELLVVDSGGDSPGIRQLLEDFTKVCPQTRPSLILSKAGSATQRNKGADAASGDIVLFLDDDVVLDPDFISGLIVAYEKDNSRRVGGVQGVVTEAVRKRSLPRVFFSWLYAVSFMQSRTANCQKVLASGKYIGYPARATGSQKHSYAKEYSEDIQWMSGCCMSVRKEILQTHGLRFDENFEALGPFAHMEDGDFSYRIFLMGYCLVRSGRAVCFHGSAAGSRKNLESYYAIKAYNHFLFWRKNVGVTRPLSVFLFVWSQVGLMIESVVKTLIIRNKGPFKGVFLGWRFILKTSAKF